MQKQTKDFTVLVVDDEPLLTETIANDFKRKGFNVYTASSGSSALKVIESHKVDLVVSDIRMPDGDGLSLLEGIRKTSPHIIVILMTGFTDYSEEDCLKKGAKCVLQKPFIQKQLRAKVFEYLNLTE